MPTTLLKIMLLCPRGAGDVDGKEWEFENINPQLAGKELIIKNHRFNEK